VFQGASQLSLDAKGRMTIPSRYRDALRAQCDGSLTVTRHPAGCLMLFPRPVWEAHRQRIADWPISASSWRRIFLGNASDVEMDGAGRVLISPELRGAVSLEKDVMLVGMGGFFEIWDAATLSQSEAKALQSGMPDVVSNYSF